MFFKLCDLEDLMAQKYKFNLISPNILQKKFYYYFYEGKFLLISVYLFENSARMV